MLAAVALSSLSVLLVDKDRAESLELDAEDDDFFRRPIGLVANLDLVLDLDFELDDIASNDAPVLCDVRENEKGSCGIA